MLKINNLSYKYKKDFIFENISFNINDNTINYLYGSNGSGKSTLLELINGSLIFRSGEIENTFKKVFFMPDHLTLPSLINTIDYLECIINQEASKFDIMFFMEKYKVPNKRIGKLSKGMKKKLLLICVLLTKSDLYLLDEPYDGLDIESINMFKNDLKASKKTFLISVHEELGEKEKRNKIGEKLWIKEI